MQRKLGVLLVRRRRVRNEKKKSKRPGSVSPIVEHFVDPCQESDGAIMKRVADGLRFRGLLVVVPGAFEEESG